MRHVKNECNYCCDSDTHKDNFDNAVGTLALYLSGIGVNQETIWFFSVEISTYPDRQQNMFKCDFLIVGVGAMNALLVTSDISADGFFDDRPHLIFGIGKTIFQPDCVALNFKSAQEFRLIGAQFVEIPWFQLAG